MKLISWTSSLAIAFVLTACSPEQAQVDTPAVGAEAIDTDQAYESYLAFANETFSITGASEADLSLLSASLPDYARLSWDSKTFDAATGATVFEDLTLGFGDAVPFGLTIETAKIWGYDDTLLVSRLGGERLDESGALFTRLEGENLSYFGVAPALNAFIDEILEQVETELPEEFELGFDTIETNTDRFVMSGVSLRPWELSLLPSEWVTDLDEDMPEEVIDFIHTGQRLIAVTRSLAIEKSVTIGTEVSLEMRQPGVDLITTSTVDFAAAEGLQGFDVARNMAWGTETNQTSTYNDMFASEDGVTVTGFPAGLTLKQDSSVASAAVNDMRLDKLMGYLAQSQLPDMNERDLLSFGRWLMTDYSVEFDDKTILTAESAFFNGDGFEWVIPSDLSFGMTGATFNTGELTDFFYVFFEAGILSTLPDGDDEVAAEMERMTEGVQKAIELLPEHGLDVIPFDVSVSASWDADSGPAALSTRWDAEGFGRNEIDLSIDLPIYDALKTAFESEDRETAFEEAFTDAFAFRGARWFEEDKGAYDKLFGFAHALGKEYPNEGWGAMLGNMEPQQMRTYLGTMTRLGAGAAAAEFPPAAEWIESMANHLETGGSLELASNPPTPITPTLIDDYDEEPSAEEIVEIFGLTVTHTK